MSYQINLQSIRAAKKYNSRFDNDLYRKAIEGKGNKYANLLIDEALALCGDPTFTVSGRKWNKAAEKFLALYR